MELKPDITEKSTHACFFPALHRLFQCTSWRHQTELTSQTQNAAAQILRDFNILPLLPELHWLPVISRIDFIIRLITFKALNGRVPNYIKDILTTYGLVHSRGSMNGFLLAITWFPVVNRCNWVFGIWEHKTVEMYEYWTQISLFFSFS